MIIIFALLAALASHSAQMSDMARCEAAIAPFEQLAERLDTELACFTDFTVDTVGWESEAAGLYFAEDVGQHSLAAIRIHGADQLYYGDVAAHELGHAWQARVLGHDGIDWVQDALGLDREGHADVFAYSLGYWRDYGNGWRHPQGVPAHDLILKMRAASLLPAADAVHSDRTITNPEGL